MSMVPPVLTSAVCWLPVPLHRLAAVHHPHGTLDLSGPPAALQGEAGVAPKRAGARVEVGRRAVALEPVAVPGVVGRRARLG